MPKRTRATDDTISDNRGRETPCSVYELRLNADGLEHDEVIHKICSIAKKWVLQLECSDGGYLHYQGRISLIKKKRWGEAKAQFQEVFPGEGDIRPTLNKEFQKTAFYCMKEDTRVLGPWTNQDDEKMFMPYQYAGKEKTLMPFQQTIWDSADVRDDRIVNVIFDPEGNRGKTTIARLMRLFKRGYFCPPINNSQDLMQGLCDMFIGREERDPKCMFFDLPRAMDKRYLGGMYSAIEEVKNGYVYDTRYRFREWWFHSPQVWIFTNSEPDLSALSADRWRIWSITPEKTLIPWVKEDPQFPSE